MVQDGAFQERSTITLVVEGDPEGTEVWGPPEGLWLVLGLVAASLGALALSYYAGYRRSRARRGA
jgi:hypothetical protein